MIDLGPDPTSMSRPRLRPGVRLAPDPARRGWALLGPESVVPLVGSAAEILALCDGRTSVAEISARLADRHGADLSEVSVDVAGFLHDLANGNGSQATTRPGPTAILAELTHRCPLGCPYCSNPIDPPTGRGELDEGDWARVLFEAAAMGALQVHFSGGEPMLRPDLPRLIAAARSSGLYSNLITSGIRLDRGKAVMLREAGLDHAQVSLQADEPELADAIAGRPAHRSKLEAARAVAEAGIVLTINIVLHRANLDRLAAMIERAESLGPARIELAHAQYYGWAWRNRAALMPSRGQIEAAAAVVADAHARLRGRIELIHVAPDYFGGTPKPCMNGWGRRQLTVDPTGDVLPCPTARSIPTLRFENVRDRPLGAIWAESEAFNRFRGTAWMPEPCRSCDRREIDLGGCRCQAFLLTGDATATDPACVLAPHRGSLTQLLTSDNPAPPLAYRRNPVLRGETRS